MPKDAPLEENFKDYILGTYDNEPKTPEWATAICGVPADVIRRLAEEVASAEKVDFFAGQSTTKIPAGEAFGQIFYTFAFMHGGIGMPGNYVSWVGLHEGMSTTPYANAGDSSNGKGLNPANPLTPPMLGFTTNIVEAEENWDAWDWIEYSEAWQSCLDGAYGRDIWPKGKKPLDIHMIYVGGYSNPLNQLPNTNAAIELFRKVDFVVGGDPFFNASMRYCDVVLPVSSWWEKGELAWHNNDDTVFWADRIIEPLYESRSEYQIVQGLVERMDVDLAKVDTMTATERTYYSLAGAFYAVDDMGTTKPLLTITQEDLDELGIVPFDGGTTTVMNNGAPLEVRGLSGEPQEGLLTIGEFKERGFYQIERAYGDALTHVPYADFFTDPVKNARPTGSGKFEIHSAALAGAIAANGFSQIAPIGKWQFNPEQGQGAQTEEYPLLLWTPHSLRRAHSTNDSVTTLREAFPQECFMSTVDAEARGIKSGDIVLMSSSHGKVLRPAKVMPTVIPGAVALQDGAWTNIDEATGIDIGGNPNILQAPAASGQGVQAWTGTICQVEKYTGDIKLEPDKKRALVLPKGIE
jgi:anaerobic dimethyl sulfoxide reductase subunit A